MKNFSNIISLATILILLAYILYRELKDTKDATRDVAFSDSEVAIPATIEIDDYGQPFPAIAFDIPEKVSFADEPVPLSITDVHERLDKELQINSYLHSNTIFLIKRANRWLPQMEAILKKHNIPEDFKYLPLIESNLLNVVSPRKAVGYWQILPESAKEFGLKVTKEVDERYDPLKSTEAACKYLARAYKKFNNWALVAASYNRGIGGVSRSLAEQRVNSYYDLYLNDETSRYVFRIIAIKEIIEHPAKYGFKINPKNLYQQEAVHFVKVEKTIDDLITFSKQQGINYKLLKRFNPWLRENRLVVKKNESYKIAIPATKQ